MFGDPITLFSRVARLSLVSLLILILAGGIVRSSGSGMGCPDWPKCFNRWIPPTHASELPANFQDRYVQSRLKKNKRLSVLLRSLGFKELSSKLDRDPSILNVEPFNAFNTWTEYINRLIGVITGFLFLGLFMISVFCLKSAPELFWVSGLNLILIFIQAYLGSIVVSTHLLSGIISLHMILAVLILILLMSSLNRSLIYKGANPSPILTKNLRGLSRILMVSMIMVFIQIVMGTLVRESIDNSGWAQFTDAQFFIAAGIYFPIHRFLALFLFILNLFLVYFVYRSKLGFIRSWVLGSVSCIILQLVIGLSLEIWHLPPFSQAVHVFLAVLLFSVQLWAWFLVQSMNSSDLSNKNNVVYGN